LLRTDGVEGLFYYVKGLLMEIQNCSKKDFDQILTDIEEFWGSKRTLHLHTPILINEFGDTAFVINDEGTVCAYLFGFYSQTEPLAYVHLIGVRNNYKRKGYGKMLYEHFIKLAKERNCTKIKAITSVTNQQSIKFHKSIGMELIGDDIIDGVNVVLNYSGPGEHRVVFEKEI
jgi:ribosomal protein S18 acetylase RimI-like enzyme